MSMNYSKNQCQVHDDTELQMQRNHDVQLVGSLLDYLAPDGHAFFSTTLVKQCCLRLKKILEKVDRTLEKVDQTLAK
jgi:hypothetical protein